MIFIFILLFVQLSVTVPLLKFATFQAVLMDVGCYRNVACISEVNATVNDCPVTVAAMMVCD